MIGWQRAGKQNASSIEHFGIVNPALIGGDGEIIPGHGRVEAAKQLGLKTVPTLALLHLTGTEKRAYLLADNRLALNAGWDREIFAIELQGLVDLDFDVQLGGFSLAKIDFVFDEAGEAYLDTPDAVEDALPDIFGPAVSRITVRTGIHELRHQRRGQPMRHVATARSRGTRTDMGTGAKLPLTLWLSERLCIAPNVLTADCP